MFNLTKKQQTMAKHIEPDPTSINLIGTGTVIKGEVNSTGDIRIDGTLTGQVRCKGKIVVGTTGVLEGEVYCQNADFSGNINGKVEVAELLTLKSSARFFGDIITNKLAIEPGANFTGTCTMEKSVRQKDTAPGDKKPLEEKVTG
jgi:cytoskeletal protein CcmA (bactofilin family)